MVGFDQLAQRLDDKLEADGVFTGRSGGAWKTMCGLTHGGLEQLNWRVGENGEIGCYFEQVDVRRLLASSTSELLKMAVQFLGAMGRQAASQEVSAKYISLYSESAHK
jgi:hypothetical protein